MKLLPQVVALALVLICPVALADQCHLDSDCERGSCSGGACVDLEANDRMLLAINDPDGKHELETRSNWLVGVIGAGVFGAAYIGAIVAVSATDGRGNKRQAIVHSFIPVAGPLLIERHQQTPDGLEIPMFLSMFAQAGGLVTAIFGLTTEHKVLVPKDRAPKDSASDTEVSVAPIVGPGTVGIEGSF